MSGWGPVGNTWSKTQKKKLFSHAQHDRLDDVRQLIAKLLEPSNSACKLVSLIDSIRDPGGDSLLVRASRGAALNVVRWLLESGANPDQMNEKLYKAPLHEAASVGSVETVLLLLDFGASIGFTKYNGWSPLSYACQNGHVEVARCLLERTSVEEKKSSVEESNKEGSCNLYLSCRSQHSGIVSLLLSLGADPNRGNNNLRRPAHACAMNGNTAISQLLSKSGADFSAARDSSGSTVWHEAARQGQNSYISEFLAEHLGPESLALLPTTLDNSKRHPLHVAARYGHLDSVRALVQLCGDEKVLNAQDVDGATPLHLSVLHNHINVLQFLVGQPGINLEITTSSGLTPLALARSWKHERCISFLSQTPK